MLLLIPAEIRSTSCTNGWASWSLRSSTTWRDWRGRSTRWESSPLRLQPTWYSSIYLMSTSSMCYDHLKLNNTTETLLPARLQYLHGPPGGRHSGSHHLGGIFWKLKTESRVVKCLFMVFLFQHYRYSVTYNDEIINLSNSLFHMFWIRTFYFYLSFSKSIQSLLFLKQWQQFSELI